MINLKNIDDYTLVIVGTNGAIEYFGEKEEYRYHIEALKDYFYTYYFDLANQVDADNMRNNEDIIFYLNQFGKCVILNSDGYALCYVPLDINNNQKVTLCNLFQKCLSKKIYIETDFNGEKRIFKYTGDDSINFLGNSEVKDNGRCI